MRRGQSHKKIKGISSEEESEQNRKGMEKETMRDYISLRIKGANKAESTQDLSSVLKDYSQENYRNYVSWLSSMIKNEPPFRFESAEMLTYFQLGMNLCFYGVGSKKQYLRHFINTYFCQYHVWEVKGYLPSLNEKKIYNQFGMFLVSANFVDEFEKVSMKDLLEEYREILTKKKKRVIVVFHCLDGQNFLSSDAQAKLSDLLSLPNIQTIASIDNSKIVRYWGPKTKEKFKFLFFNVNTRIPTVDQQYYKPHTTEKKDTTQQSLKNIWQCLNRNQKKILKIITKNQLDNLTIRQQHSNYTVSELLDICIEEVILASDVQLRENLLQLLDHKVVMQRMDEKRFKKVIIIKYERKILEKILQLKVD